MQKATRYKKAFSTFFVVLVLAGTAAAQDKKPEGKPLDRKALDESIYQSLRGIIDHGADLYNQGDWNGCYRLWEGTLMSLKPLLDHRPKLQESIDGGLSKARQESVLWQRAWALRPVLDKIRSDINADYPHKRKSEQGEPPLAKDEPKKEEEKKPAEKKESKEPVNTQVTGTVMYKGKPAVGAKISFLAADGKVVSDTIAADGSYKLSVKPGEYTITISGPAKLGLPAKYAAANTSGLKLNVVGEKQTHDLNLQ